MSNDLERLGGDNPFEGVATDAVAGAMLGLVAAGPLGSAVGFFTPFASRMLGLSMQELRMRGQRGVAMHAWLDENLDGRDFDELVEKSPSHRHLAESATEAASRSLYPERILVIGQALRDGLLSDDDAELDHQQQFIDAVSTLERIHLRVMLLMLNETVDDNGVAHWERPASDWQEISLAGDSIGESLPRILATLEAEGLVSRQTHISRIDGGTPSSTQSEPRENEDLYWWVTPFGISALAKLKAAATDLGTDFSALA